MADYESELSIRERSYDDAPADWKSQVPFNGEAIPPAVTADVVADVVRRAVTGDLAGHDTHALSGLLLARGVEEAECKRIAAYVVADRDTLVIAKYPEIQPYYLPRRGQTWGMFAA